MDLDYLQKIISKIDLKEQNISTIAQYCIVNSKDCQAEVTKIIDKQFPTYYNQKMLAILVLVSQIFLRSWEKKDSRFFKSLAPKSKIYIQQISKRHKQIKQQHLRIIPNILANWSQPGKQLFALSFMDRLRKIAEPIIIKANRLEEQKNNKLFQNYSKTFLMEYEDIKGFEPASRIYDSYTIYENIAVQIGQINIQMKKLGLTKVTPEIVSRAIDIQKLLKKFAQQLEQLVYKCHVDFKILRENCQVQFDKLPAQAKQVLQNATD